MSIEKNNNPVPPLNDSLKNSEVLEELKGKLGKKDEEKVSSVLDNLNKEFEENSFEEAYKNIINTYPSLKNKFENFGIYNIGDRLAIRASEGLDNLYVEDEWGKKLLKKIVFAKESDKGEIQEVIDKEARRLMQEGKREKVSNNETEESQSGNESPKELFEEYEKDEDLDNKLDKVGLVLDKGGNVRIELTGLDGKPISRQLKNDYAVEMMKIVKDLDNDNEQLNKMRDRISRDLLEKTQEEIESQVDSGDDERSKINKEALTTEEKIKVSQDIETAVNSAKSLESLAESLKEIEEIPTPSGVIYGIDVYTSILKLIESADGVNYADVNKKKLENIMSSYGITSKFGIRDKVMALLLSGKHLDVEDALVEEKNNDKIGESEKEKKEEENKEEKTEEGEIDFEKLSLEELRRAYVEARIRRGSVLDRRSVKVGDEKIKMFWKKGGENLKMLREAYERKLRDMRDGEIEGFLKDKGLESVKELDEHQQSVVMDKIVELQKREQDAMDEMLENDFERTRLEKFRNFWKRTSKGRMVFGIGGSATIGAAKLLGASVPNPASALLLAGRGILGSASAYVGVEGLLERVGWLSQKGDLEKLQKEAEKAMKKERPELQKSSGEDKFVAKERREFLREWLERKVNNETDDFSAESLQKMASKLSMLQIEKRTSISRAGVWDKKTSDLVSAIVEEWHESVAQKAVERNESEEDQLMDALSEKYSAETKSFHETSEGEMDRERKLKLARRISALGAAGLIGAVLGTKAAGISEGADGSDMVDADEVQKLEGVRPLTKSSVSFDRDWVDIGLDVPEEFEHPSPESASSIIQDASTLDEASVYESPEVDLSVKIESGDNLWSVIESKLEEGGYMDGFATEGEKTHLIDAMKDRFAEMSPEELREIGFSSGNIDELAVGDEIDLSSVLGDDEVVSKWVLNTNELSDKAIEAIEANNETIAEWHGAHPDVSLDTETVTKVIETNGTFEPEVVAETIDENLSESAEASEQITSPEKFELAQAVEVAKEADRVERGLIEEAFGKINGEKWQGVKGWEGAEFMEHDFNTDVESKFQKDKIQFQRRLKKLRDLSGAYPKEKTFYRDAETVGEYLKRASKLFAQDKIKNAPLDEWLDTGRGKAA